MTMLLFKSIYPENCGIVKLNDQLVVTNFDEKPLNPKSNLASGAIYILSKEMLKFLSRDEYNNAKDFSNEIINKFLGKIYTYKTDNDFIDIGNIKNLKIANSFQQ